MEKAAAELGWHAQPEPHAILSQPHNGRAACMNCGFCMWYGCEAGAKSSTLAAMVPLAGWIVAGEALAVGLSVVESAELVAELSEAAGPQGMVGGQALDLIAEGQAVTGAGLVEIHRRKTGALIRAAARLGGRAGRLEPRTLQAITDYGAQVGLAFQIADDVLDEEGTTASLGKDAHSDRELGKATYPGVFGMEQARAEARRLAEEAVEALRRAGIESPSLEGLAIHVVERES